MKPKIIPMIGKNQRNNIERALGKGKFIKNARIYATKDIKNIIKDPTL